MRERKEIEENLVKEVNSKNDNVMQQLLIALLIQNGTLLDIRELLIEQKKVSVASCGCDSSGGRCFEHSRGMVSPV